MQSSIEIFKIIGSDYVFRYRVPVPGGLWGQKFPGVCMFCTLVPESLHCWWADLCLL